MKLFSESKRIRHQQLKVLLELFQKLAGTWGGAPEKRQPRYVSALQPFSAKQSPYGDQISRIKKDE
jgi:hypothetical protein